MATSLRDVDTTPVHDDGQPPQGYGYESHTAPGTNLVNSTPRFIPDTQLAALYNNIPIALLDSATNVCSGAASIAKVPAEIHVEILRHLPPPQFLTMIQLVPEVRMGISNWNMTHLTAQQLVYLHRFISNAIGIESGRRRRFITADVRNKIVNALPTAIEVYKNTSNFPLEPNDFNCHYDKLITMLPRPGAESKLHEEVAIFLENFHHKNRSVREFCREVADLDRQGKIVRYPKCKLNQGALVSHLLFWLATDYIRAQSTQKSETIVSHWNEFDSGIAKIFGPDMVKAFRNCVFEYSILNKYREYVRECSSSHLTTMHATLSLCQRLDSLDGFDAYPIYMLSRGLDHALYFLKEPAEGLRLIEEHERDVIAWGCAWEAITTDFGNPHGC